MWRYWMTQESDDFNLLLGNGKRLNPFVELAKKLAGMSEFTLGALYSIIDETLPKEKADKIKEITRKCDEELTVNDVKTILHFDGANYSGCFLSQNILGDDGILIYHSMTRTAPMQYALLSNFSDFSYWSLINVLHVPATQVRRSLSPKHAKHHLMVFGLICILLFFGHRFH